MAKKKKKLLKKNPKRSSNIKRRRLEKFGPEEEDPAEKALRRQKRAERRRIKAIRARIEEEQAKEMGISIALAPFQPLPAQKALVAEMVGLGFNLKDIRMLILNPETGKPISNNTFVKRFEKEIREGRVLANLAVVRSIHDVASDRYARGHARLATLWAKSQMGWKETTEVEVSDKSGVLVVPNGMTPDAWVKQQEERNAEMDGPDGPDDEDDEDDDE